jgi:hypothetical protein
MAAAILRERLIGGLSALSLIFGTTIAILLLIGIATLISNAVRRWRLARRYDFGPRGNATWAQVDEHFDEFLADNPDIQAGLIRLESAIRKQKKGDRA